MAGLFSFRCTQCGELHAGSPGFAFQAPAPYHEQDARARRIAEAAMHRER